MEDREKAKDTLAQLEQENAELQRNLANVRNAEAEIMGRLNQNIGAQKILRQIFPEIGEQEEAGEAAPAEDPSGEKAPAEPENKPDQPVKKAEPAKK